MVVAAGNEGPGEKESGFRSSVSRICERVVGVSQRGGRMLARFWRLSRRASQRGRGVGKGGVRGCVGP